MPSVSGSPTGASKKPSIAPRKRIRGDRHAPAINAGEFIQASKARSLVVRPQRKIHLEIGQPYDSHANFSDLCESNDMVTPLEFVDVEFHSDRIEIAPEGSVQLEAVG